MTEQLFFLNTSQCSRVSQFWLCGAKMQKVHTSSQVNLCFYGRFKKENLALIKLKDKRLILDFKNSKNC